jgi:hypothetical protein
MLNPSKVAPLTPFGTFMGATPVLPSMYWDVYSAEQRWKAMAKLLKKLCEYVEYMGDEINIDRDSINALWDEFQKFIDGEYDDYYKNLIADWIRDNFAELISAGIKQVYFGLTDDGYFCAYIPDSWSEITFDTGAVFGRSDYGRLILKFEADPNAQGVIDNTYSNYTLNAKQLTLQQIIADLEVTARRGDASYNTLFTNLDTEVSNGNF